MKKDYSKVLDVLNKEIKELQYFKKHMENNFNSLISSIFQTNKFIEEDVKVKAEFRCSKESRRVHIGLAKNEEMIFGTSTSIWIEYDVIKKRTVFSFHPLGGMGQFEVEYDLIRADAIKLQSKVLDNVVMIKHLIDGDKTYNDILNDLYDMYEEREKIEREIKNENIQS